MATGVFMQSQLDKNELIGVSVFICSCLYTYYYDPFLRCTLALSAHFYSTGLVQLNKGARAVRLRLPIELPLIAWIVFSILHGYHFIGWQQQGLVRTGTKSLRLIYCQINTYSYIKQCSSYYSCWLAAKLKALVYIVVLSTMDKDQLQYSSCVNKGNPKEQGTLAEEELLDHPSSEPYSFCHLQPPRINASAPILWTHLHQNPCFHIHTQVHVAGPICSDGR